MRSQCVTWQSHKTTFSPKMEKREMEGSALLNDLTLINYY